MIELHRLKNLFFIFILSWFSSQTLAQTNPQSFLSLPVAKSGSAVVTVQELSEEIYRMARRNGIFPESIPIHTKIELAESLLADKILFIELEKQNFDKNLWVQSALISFLMRQRNMPDELQEDDSKEHIQDTSDMNTQPNPTSNLPNDPKSLDRNKKNNDLYKNRDSILKQLKSKSNIQINQVNIQQYMEKRRDGTLWNTGVFRDPTPKEDIIATIDGDVVTVQELELSLNRFGFRIDSESGKNKDDTVSRAVQYSIDNRILVKEAIRKGAAKDPFVRRRIMRTIRSGILPFGFLEPPLTEEDLKSYYQAHPDEFKVTERVVIIRWLILSNEIKNGNSEIPLDKDFVKAKAENIRNSQMKAVRFGIPIPSIIGEENGIVWDGFWYLTSKTQTQIPQDTLKSLLALKPGQIGPLVKVPKGWVIPVATARQPIIPLTYEQAKGQIAQRLLAQRRRLWQQIHLRELQLSLGVDIFLSNIENMKVAFKSDKIETVAPNQTQPSILEKTEQPTVSSE